MQVMNTYGIDANKLNYKHSNKIVFNRVRLLFNLLDDIILGKTIDDLNILSGESLGLLNKEMFESMTNKILKDTDLFDKYQNLFYILIKHKYFQSKNFIDNNNVIVTFISESLVKYINNDIDRFMEVMNKLPKFESFDEIKYQFWNKYNEKIMNFIVTYGVFPFLIEPVFDHRRICSFCGKVSDVTFIRCFGCRIFHYCSNLCQYRNFMIHKKICPNIFSFE